VGTKRALVIVVLSLAFTGGAAWAAGGMDGADTGAPTITQVQNNYSWILPGASNYGIAPGSIFVILGSGLSMPGAQAVLQDSSQKGGLPLTLNGASVTVVVSGITEHPALYYATPTAIAAVLPSTTPLGTGTVTVTYNGVTSAPATLQVLLSALGLATMSGDGTGPAMATDANYNFISPTNSAASGQVITLWGTGLGASPADSDTTYTPTPHQITSIPLTVFFENQQTPVVWAGRSGYPGLDQINVQVPIPAIPELGYENGVYGFYGQVVLSLGCSTWLVVVDSGTGVGSNTVTLPITMAGGACSQPSFVLDPGVAQAFSGQSTVNFGSLSVSQYAGQALAGGSFNSIPGSALAAFAGSGTASGGSCIIVPAAGTYPINLAGLGGPVGVTGPAGEQGLATGDYADYGGVLPASTIPSSGETFTFINGGNQYATVGPFSTAVTFPAALEWTNQSSIYGITRAQGLELTWTGGDANGVVAIRGSSFAAAGSQTPGASFLCSAPAGLGQFTIPASILQTLPPGAGTLTVENQSAAESISANGLDIGSAHAGAVHTINVAYN
jgi:uncharacterized protein (TIGR03437 family)